jgi:thiol-disulfide isomerase/thioredoxin
MKFNYKLLLVALTIGLLTSQAANAVVIKGSILNSPIPRPDSIFVFDFKGSMKTKIAAAFIKDDAFKFNLDKSVKGHYFLGFDATKGFDIIVWEKDLTLNLNPRDFAASLPADKETSDFRIFNKKLIDVQADLQNIYRERNTKMEKIRTQVAADSLLAVYNKKEKDKDQELEDFLKSFSNRKGYLGEVSNYILGPNKSLFKPDFSEADFKNIYGTQGEFQFAKTTYFIKYKYTYTAEGYEAGILELLTKAPRASDSKRLLNYMLFDLYASADTDKLEELLKGFLDEFPNDKQGLAYKAKLPKPQPKVGAMAPDIVLNDPDGKTLKLSDLKGKVVLIDFWASWCGPCRAENPNVVNTYKKYKDKGFTIYSVSLDNNAQNWRAAIQKDGLEWEWHVSDLLGWRSAGAALYAVQSIPAAFLIDREGKIVAKNLRGAALEQKVKEIVEKP